PATRLGVVPAGSVSDAGVLSLASASVGALDLDADGIVNLVHMPGSRRYEVFSPVADGSGGFEWGGRPVQTGGDQDVKIDVTRDPPNTRVLDVNGDGLVDVVYSSATELQTFFSLGRLPGGDGQFGQGELKSASSAEISLEPAVYCLPYAGKPVRFS